jgi:hypothetical protein
MDRRTAQMTVGDRQMKLDISTRSVAWGCRDPTSLASTLAELGRNVPSAEVDPQVFGTGTVAVLKAIRTDLGLPPPASSRRRPCGPSMPRSLRDRRLRGHCADRCAPAMAVRPPGASGDACVGGDGGR